MKSWRARPDSPARCSHSVSSSSNGSVSSSRHPSPTGAGIVTSSRRRATTSSKSACRSASGGHAGSRSPRRTSIPSWRCGRCAMRFAGTGSRIDASSSASTSRAVRPPLPRRVVRARLRRGLASARRCRARRAAADAVSAIGCSSSSGTPRSARRPGPRRGPLRHGGRRSLRQMARRPAHLGPGHARRPHTTRRPPVAGTSLPNLERPQHVRPHQAEERLAIVRSCRPRYRAITSRTGAVATPGV